MSLYRAHCRGLRGERRSTPSDRAKQHGEAEVRAKEFVQPAEQMLFHQIELQFSVTRRIRLDKGAPNSRPVQIRRSAQGGKKIKQNLTNNSLFFATLLRISPS